MSGRECSVWRPWHFCGMIPAVNRRSPFAEWEGNEIPLVCRPGQGGRRRRPSQGAPCLRPRTWKLVLQRLVGLVEGRFLHHGDLPSGTRLGSRGAQGGQKPSSLHEPRENAASIAGSLGLAVDSAKSPPWLAAAPPL
jgi:hypothetical protein